MHHLIFALLLASGGDPGLCYFEGSDVTDMTQQCHYSCLEGDVTITIDALEMCPMNLDDE